MDTGFITKLTRFVEYLYIVSLGSSDKKGGGRKEYEQVTFK